jgi:exonuclease SbcD
MKIAVIADSHFDEAKRFDECIRLHTWIARDAMARGVDLVLHAGDVYERKSTPLEREAAAAWFQGMAEIAPVVIVRGNHDAVDDLPLLERLEARHPIRVVQTAEVVFIAGAAVACVAWPRKAALLAAAAADGKEVGELAAGDALRAVLRGLGDQLEEHDGPRVLLAHAMVRGSVTSTGQPLVGCDMELGLEDLALARADAYALGHIHKGQTWDIDGAPCFYPGSPRRTAFGELESKGYTVLTIDAYRCCDLEFVEAPATPMIHLDGHFTLGSLERDFADPRGAEVRLRYTVAADERDAARAAAAGAAEVLRSEGAVLVQVEEVVITETRSRTPEIARAVTLADKLEAFWSAKGFEPGDRRAELLAKLNTVEEDHRHAA